jgi:hypothetical protein
VTQFTVRCVSARDDWRVMLRRLSLHEHGAIELLAGLALVAAPFVLGFGAAALVASLTAGVLLAGLGLSDEMSISAHRAADTAVAGVLVGTAAALAAGGEGLGASVLACAAAAELALTAGTRWTRPAAIPGVRPLLGRPKRGLTPLGAGPSVRRERAATLVHGGLDALGDPLGGEADLLVQERRRAVGDVAVGQADAQDPGSGAAL